jgi:hypothetical protein
MVNVPAPAIVPLFVNVQGALVQMGTDFPDGIVRVLFTSTVKAQGPE